MDDHSSGSPPEGAHLLPIKNNQFIEDFKAEANSSMVEDYQTDINNGTIEYHTESPTGFQDYIEDDCDYPTGQSPNGRNRSIDSNDY